MAVGEEDRGRNTVFSKDLANERGVTGVKGENVEPTWNGHGQPEARKKPGRERKNLCNNSPGHPEGFLPSVRSKEVQ